MSNIFDRLVRLARSEINDLIEKQSRKNPDLNKEKKPDVSDEELFGKEPKRGSQSEGWRVRVKERIKRERETWERRAEQARREYEAQSRANRRPSKKKELAKHYANLELSIGASKAEVKKAWRQLMRKYHPDRHHSDPEKYKTATELTQQLTESYRAICNHLDGR